MWTCVLERGHFWAKTLTSPRGTSCEDIAPTVLVFWQAKGQWRSCRRRLTGGRYKIGEGRYSAGFLAGNGLKEKLQEKSNGWQIQGRYSAGFLAGKGSAEKLQDKPNGWQIQGRYSAGFLAGKWSKEELQEKSNGWQIQDGKGGEAQAQKPKKAQSPRHWQGQQLVGLDGGGHQEQHQQHQRRARHLLSDCLRFSLVVGLNVTYTHCSPRLITCCRT